MRRGNDTISEKFMLQMTEMGAFKAARDQTTGRGGERRLPNAAGKRSFWPQPNSSECASRFGF
jgi:hypothetical protein